MGISHLIEKYYTPKQSEGGDHQRHQQRKRPEHDHDSGEHEDEKAKRYSISPNDGLSNKGDFSLLEILYY